MKCETLQQVEIETNNLDKATLVDLQINDGGVIKEVTNYKGVYNTSQGELACIVSNRYNLVQHKEFFDSFATALDRLNIGYEIEFKKTGTATIADVMFKERNLKFENLDEEFITGIRLINSFDRRHGITIAPRFTRLACSNGMILSRFEKKLSLRHSSNGVLELNSLLEKNLSEIINNNIDLQKWISASIADSIEWLNACKIISKLVPKMTHQKGILKNLKIEVNKDKKTKKLNYVNNNKNTEFNRWQLYNAVTAYITHGEQITPLIEQILYNKTQKLLFEKLQTIKV